MGEAWGMIKKRGGRDRRDWSYPVITNGNEIAAANKEKAELLANTFVRVHSSNNLSEAGRRKMEKIESENKEGKGKYWR